MTVADAWFILPLWAKLIPLIYFICIIILQFSMQLLTTVFAGVASQATSVTRYEFWYLTIAFWAVWFSLMRAIFCTREEDVIAACLEEYVTHYLKIRPLASVEEQERKKRWNLLADEMNKYIQTKVHIFDSSVMERFHLEDWGVQDMVKKYIEQFDLKTKGLPLEEGAFQELEPKLKLLFKLKQAYINDSAIAYKVIFEESDASFDQSQSGSNSTAEVV